VETGIRLSSPKLERFVLAELVLVSLFFNPFLGLDPYNLPKMLLLTCLVSISFLFLKRVRREEIVANKLVYSGVALWILGLCATLILNSNPLTEKIYGISGRHLGFITLLCFLILAIQSIQASSINIVTRSSKAILFIGSLLVPYSFLQYLEYDFSILNSVYNEMPTGTFGNPDFNSVVLSFIGITCLWAILYESKRILWKAILFTYFSAACFLIYATHAAQGFWSLFIGCLIIIYSYFHPGLSEIKRRIFGITTLVTAVVIFLGMLSVGPFSKLNDIGAVKVRLYYWAAGVCAGNMSPIFGVGFDEYGDLYRRCRPDDAFIWDPNRVTDVSHNIYIDYFVSGGLILLSGYIFLVLATLKKISSILKSSSELVRKSSLLVAIFFAFLAQGFISINQIGLAIWGWIFMGLILGFPLGDTPQKFKGKQLVKSSPVSGSITAAISLLILVFTTLTVVPPINAAQNFKKAIVEGKPVELEASLFNWPTDRARLKFGIQVLQASGQVDLARSAIVKAIAIFPDDFSLWQIYLSIFKGSPKENEALVQLERLDPRFYDAARGNLQELLP